MIHYRYRFEMYVGLVPNEEALNALTVDEGWELVEYRPLVSREIMCENSCIVVLRRPEYFSGPDGKRGKGAEHV